MNNTQVRPTVNTAQPLHRNDLSILVILNNFYQARTRIDKRYLTFRSLMFYSSLVVHHNTTFNSTCLKSSFIICSLLAIYDVAFIIACFAITRFALFAWT